jgi:hypothetical protein
VSTVCLSLFIWGSIVILVLLGWLAPLIVGIRRHRRKAGGKVLIGVGAAWGLLALGLVGMATKSFYELDRTYNHEVSAFTPASYTGAVGTLTFGYDLAGTLKIRHEGAEGSKWWTVGVSNATAVVPAGPIKVDDLSFSVTDAKGKVLGSLNCDLSAENQSFSLATNGQRRIAGGFPLTASIDASKRDAQLSLGYKLADAAGNRVTWNAAGQGRKPPAFEAVSPAGKCFWRDNFEYG